MNEAAKVTEEDVLFAIYDETYTVLPNGRTTICQLTLYNGFTVEGSSACVNIENFNAEIGRQMAKKEAIGKVWHVLGFRLAERQYYTQDQPPAPTEVEPAIQQGDRVAFYEHVDGKITPPMLALVLRVHNQTYVDVVVFAANGSTHARTTKVIYSPGDDLVIEEALPHFVRLF